MIRKRKGKDLTLLWQVTPSTGTLAQLGIANLLLEAVDRNGFVYAIPISAIVDGTKIKAVWDGSKQRSFGVYKLTLWYNKDGANSTCVDLLNAIELVSSTTQESTDSSELEIQEGVILTPSGFEFAVAGLSAYEIALTHGFVGSEEQWLESLKGEDGSAYPPDNSTLKKNSSGKIEVKDEGVTIHKLENALKRAICEPEATLKITPNLVEAGAQTNILLNVTTSSKVGLDVESISITDDDGNSYDQGVVLKSFSEGYHQLLAEVIFEGEIDAYDTEEIVAVRKMYFGSAASLNLGSLLIAENEQPLATSPVGEVNLKIKNNAEYLFFIIPSSMTINGALYYGNEFPMSQITSTMTGYKMYRSDYKYNKQFVKLNIY